MAVRKHSFCLNATRFPNSLPKFIPRDFIMDYKLIIMVITIFVTREQLLLSAWAIVKPICVQIMK